jgi:hypothetical protein
VEAVSGADLGEGVALEHAARIALIDSGAEFRHLGIVALLLAVKSGNTGS